MVASTFLLLIWSSQSPNELRIKAQEALDSRQPEEVIRLMGELLREGQATDALADLDTESRSDLHAAYLLRGAAYHMLGASEKAASDFGQAIEIAPDDVVARLSLARIRLRQARLEEARRELAAVVAGDRSHAEAHHLLGVVYLDISREPGAARERALGEARRALERALELRPRHAPTVAILTVVLDELGLFADSEVVFTQALDGWRQEPALVKELALIYLRLLNFKRAANAFERLPAEGPEAAFRAFNLGYSYREARRHEEAKQFLQQAVALDPGSAQAQLMLGSVLLRLGETDKARPPLERALGDSAVAAQAHNEMARLVGSRGDVDAALGHCRQAIELRPDLAEPHYQLGQFLARAGRTEEAARALERFEVLKKLSEEVQRLSGRVSHYTDDVTSYLELSPLYRQQGRPDKAADALRQAGQLDPDRLTIPLAMADLLIEQRLYAEALTFSRQALAREPKNAVALWQVSSIHLAQNDPLQAEQSLRRLLEVDPEHARGLNDLGVLLERDGRYEEAIAALERAVAADPDFALPHNGLGVAYFNRGDYVRAAACFERVVELAPAYAQARLNLAEAYRRLGREAEAEAQTRAYERLQREASEPGPSPPRR